MLSAVAGIVDRKGGLRVVVTQRWRLRHHVNKGERLFVVPGYEVQEPVPWDDIPPLIERVQKHVASTLAPSNGCGTCVACCFQFAIDDPPVKKSSHQWCQNCAVDFGCKIYHARPKTCRDFECWWLASQKRNDRMPLDLRPDQCGVIFTRDSQTNDPLLIECHNEPNARVWDWINEMQAVGYKVKKITHYTG
jgi:hypothetical protein